MKSAADLYVSEQLDRLDRLGFDESDLDAPFVYRAFVTPSVRRWEARCNCGKTTQHTDVEVARAAAIKHVATHTHHNPRVRAFGVDK